MQKTLKIYQAASGQWSGKVIAADGSEVIRIAGCTSAEDVEAALREQNIELHHVEVES